MRHSWLKWMGLLWQSEYCYADMLKKHWSTLSGHRMTTGFGPFEFPTRDLLQKGWDHSPPKACFEEPSSWLAFAVL